MFSDRTGESIVVESDRDGLHIYRNTVGVMTNSPGYPWHRTNLLNYPQLRPLDYGELAWGGERLEPCFSGSGAAGLPGDWSSPSRFVRLAFLREHAVKGGDEAEGVSLLFRLLHSAAFPLGAVELTGRGRSPPTTGAWCPMTTRCIPPSSAPSPCASTGSLTGTAGCAMVELSRLLKGDRPLQFALGEEPEFCDVTGEGV